MRKRPPSSLLHVFSSFSPGGVEIRTANLIRALQHDYRHTVLSLDRRAGAEPYLRGAEARLIRGLGSGRGSGLQGLRQLIRSVSPDLVLTYNWGAFDAIIANRLSPARSIHQEDGFNADEAGKRKLRRTLARRVMLGFVDRVVVPSRHLHSIASNEWKVGQRRLVLIPNGVDVDSFSCADRNQALRGTLGIPREAPVIGSVGQLRPVKRFDRLIETFSLLEDNLDVRLVLVGDGAERPALETLVQRLGLAHRVSFVGHQEGVANFLRVMDVFVISSDSEQLPLGLLEAMAASLPVVATGVGDVAEVLPPEQQEFVVSLAGAEPTSALAARISRLLDDLALRRVLGSRNRSRVESSFSLRGMVEAYDGLYRAVLEGS